MRILGYNATDIPVFITKNMFTKDINLVKGNVSINNCIKNLVLTIFGQRAFNTQIGTTIYSNILFENKSRVVNDQYTSTTTINEIISVLMRYEPRIKDINITLNLVSSNLNLGITYTNVKTTEIQTLNIII
jgi:phage baseplate assembly protein W